ncbi:conserved hypothetical protein [Culex quinquefasciatus]|uniref:Thyroglobulin type-1 domain-containing protein n=1 Tax=Culex quinquefasciatus TaxID=7176 RepID=B0WKC4_CULQU|nr:conserved hypothetical protein [Culex quinquefasciatus]|eukprot:XP_001849158.1 conserved hypothetical protein [Culex quinquefasciatus]
MDNLLLLLIVTTITVNAQNIAPCSSTLGCIGRVDCPKGHWHPSASLDGCCPGCVQGLGLHEPGCGALSPCLPGLTCRSGSCVLDSSSCLSAEHVPPEVSWTPTCDSSGRFQPVQCRGDLLHGRCFCYSSTGRRIFGSEWRGRATDMTCACSRLRSDLEASGRQDVTLHCSSNGNFEPLQCDGGVCWCVEPKTGQPLPQVPAVLPSMWTKLPCYNSTQHGDRYLRQCESAATAQKLVQQKFTVHGHTEVALADVVCDYDGSYGPYEVQEGIAYCTWRDGQRIAQFQMSTLKLKQMTCNCARDQKIFAGAGLELKLLCDGNGNYAKLQDNNGELFCVDRDGFVVASAVSPEDDCSAYVLP